MDDVLRSPQETEIPSLDLTQDTVGKWTPENRRVSHVPLNELVYIVRICNIVKSFDKMKSHIAGMLEKWRGRPEYSHEVEDLLS